MPYVKTPGMNKEKLVFYVALLLLGVSGFLFVRAQPSRLPDAPAITRVERPTPYIVKEREPYKEIALSADRERKSPFTPNQLWKGMSTANKPDPNKGNRPPPPPPPPPKQPDTPKTPEPKGPMQPSEKDLAVGFMGVVQLEGRSYALLSSKDGGPPRRVKEGETLEGLNYTITKIEQQRIYLTDAEGRPYVLKDGRFEDYETGGGGGAGSFTQPQPKGPAPKAQPKNGAPKAPKGGQPGGRARNQPRAMQ